MPNKLLNGMFNANHVYVLANGNFLCINRKECEDQVKIKSIT